MNNPLTPFIKGEYGIQDKYLQGLAELWVLSSFGKGGNLCSEKAMVNTPLIDNVLRFIREEKLFQKGDKVLIALSGGPDSMALTDILCQLQDELGIELCAAHFNHKWRGEESDEDTRFVEEYCKQIGLDFIIGSLNEELKKRGKFLTEDGARNVRYEFLGKTASDVKANKIATGHNLNDQAETVLSHLLRGTGLRGLGGIRPLSLGNVVHPLLKTSRREIEEYLSARNIPFRQDSSNKDNRFLRNRLRNLILPILEEKFNPQIVHSLARTGEILRQEDAFLEELTAEALSTLTKKSTKGKIVLDVNGFLSYHISLRRRLIDKVYNSLIDQEKRLEFDQIEKVCRLTEVDSGISELPQRILVQKSGAYLIFAKKSVHPFLYKLPEEGDIFIPEIDSSLRLNLKSRSEIDESRLRNDLNYAVFELETLKGGLELRSRRPGDRIIPFGMSGHKKVKELFIDRKIPRILRDQIPILTDQEKIIWVVGMITNEICRVKSDTKTVLIVEFLPSEVEIY